MTEPLQNPDGDEVAQLPQLAARPAESHKGTFGRALLVGGSLGMSGAISLSGVAALRSGAGLVTVAVPRTILDVVAGFEPSYMTLPLPGDRNGRLTAAAAAAVLRAAEGMQCIGLGPGLGRSAGLTQLVGQLYQTLPLPLVVDGDGLFALAHLGEALERPGGPRVLTPHAGEFKRLLGVEDATLDELAEAAPDFARRHGVVLLLKGHRSLITNGDYRYRNPTGNPGMATGGSGDVLTGVIVALVCQGLSVLEAAQLGAHVHGLAGDLAAAELGEVSMIASDLLRFLPAAFRQMTSG